MKAILESSTHEPKIVQLKLKVLNKQLKPQDISILDPAMGTGNLLLGAFDLLMDIYQECHWLPHDIPRLIFKYNLFGLDVDPKVVRLAHFGLMMKARKFDSSVLREPPKINILAIRSYQASDLPDAPEFKRVDWQDLLATFIRGSELGSLITAPPVDSSKLHSQINAFLANSTVESQFKQQIAENLRHLIAQAEILSRQYEVVIANPPYMSLNKVSKEDASDTEKHVSTTKQLGLFE